jgi:hypothetical protein
MADLNTTLRLALRSPKEPINSEPTEALHFQEGGGAVVNNPPAPAPQPPAQMAAAPAANAPAPARPEYTVPVSGVTVIDGDHYGQGSH